MKINDLLDQSADHLQVILYQVESGELDPREIKERVRKLNSINMDLVDALPPAFKELEVFKNDNKVTFTPAYVVCELAGGSTLTIEKAREKWSPSSEECINCKQCQV